HDRAPAPGRSHATSTSVPRIRSSQAAHRLPRPGPYHVTTQSSPGSVPQASSALIRARSSFLSTPVAGAIEMPVLWRETSARPTHRAGRGLAPLGSLVFGRADVIQEAVDHLRRDRLDHMAVEPRPAGRRDVSGEAGAGDRDDEDGLEAPVRP